MEMHNIPQRNKVWCQWPLAQAGEHDVNTTSLTFVPCVGRVHLFWIGAVALNCSECETQLQHLEATSPSRIKQQLEEGRGMDAKEGGWRV